MNIIEKAKSLMLVLGASPIMYLLIGLSIASAAIVLERIWFFLRTSDDISSLGSELRDHLARNDLEGAKDSMRKSPSPGAAIVLAGLEVAHQGAESAEEEMHGALATQRARLENRLAFLGTLGNNAPFIGLFGTVIGIVTAFERLGEAGAGGGAGGSSGVMSSISEALVATAVGLLVALPAVAAYNYFQRRIKSTLARTDTLVRILLAWLKREKAPLSVYAPATRETRLQRVLTLSNSREG
jgi:biopolymer transport protein ExbB